MEATTMEWVTPEFEEVGTSAEVTAISLPSPSSIIRRPSALMVE